MLTLSISKEALTNEVDHKAANHVTNEKWCEALTKLLRRKGYNLKHRV